MSLTMFTAAPASRNCLAIFLLASVTAAASAADTVVRFDTSATAEAFPHQTTQDNPQQTQWCIPLELSSLIDSPNAPRIDQMIVEIELVDSGLTINDYSPRTVLASPYSGNIAVEKSNESTKHVGFNAAGGYGETMHGDAGGDLGQKKLESLKFQRVAPVEIVAAAGTMHRGRGVFFKLKSTPTQVLEGDKAFEIVINAPPSWRGGLITLRAKAQSSRRNLPGMAPEIVTLGDQKFLVAVYPVGDSIAFQLASSLVAAETHLRDTALRHQSTIRRRSGSTMFHQVAAKLDLTPQLIPENWLQQTLFGQADTHADPAMRRLPVDVRVAVLDYQDAKETFLAFAQSAPESTATVASK
jgi:hypothetical protein